MGSLMTTILNQELARDLPSEVTAALPADALSSISPQALASPEEAAALQAQFAGLPNGEELFAALMGAMRQALATSIHDVFLMAAIVSLGGVIAVAFLPEAPLRKRRETPELERAG
jgi:hypothetical protein